MPELKDKLIVALDVPDLKEGRRLADILYPTVKIFKVGLQLFTAAGPEAVEYLHKKGAEVFLDLKYLDIPNTVANAVSAAARLKVKMLTLHIQGGEEMLKAAVRSAKDEALRLKIKPLDLIGVTVLTSQEASPEEVLRLARLGLDCGLQGVVASVKEAALLKKSIKKDFIVVTPGIRLPSAQKDDQKRVATPEEAMKVGSDFLVVGRSIVQAADPLAAAKEILTTGGMSHG